MTSMRRRPFAFLSALAAWAPVAVLAASPAFASAATSVSSSLAFSGTGSSMTVSTSVKFTSTYSGIYTVSYNIYRSTSSTRSSPVRVTTNALSKSVSTSKGSSYTFGPNVQKCPAGTTAYYYWVQGTVGDGTVSGLVSFTGPVSAATAACQRI